MSVKIALSLLFVAAVAAHRWPHPPASCSSNQSGSGGFNCLSQKPARMPPVNTQPPVLIKTVKNGKRYLAGQGNDTFHIAHLYSDTDDYYEMGFALGQLFPEEIATMFDHIEPWLERLLEQAVKWLPSWLADIVVKVGAPVALDLLYDVTAPYMPKDFLREWQGIADGANCSVRRIQRVSLFPQLSKAACTLFLSNKQATRGGSAFHLRALDFDPTSHVADFSTLTIYHYKTKPQFANFAWVAMTGCLTCMNDIPITASEKAGGAGPTQTIPYGLPWMQMLRRSLEMENISAVNAYITEVNRANSSTPQTVGIHIGFADQTAPTEIVGFQIGYNYSQKFHWDNMTPMPTLPVWRDIVLWPKNSQPATSCVMDMVNATYGRIDADWMANYYSPNDMTGDTQVVGFDLKDMIVYYANSRKSTADGPLCAYYRQRTWLNMSALFAEPAP